MRNSKLAILTILALPLPVFAALISIHCHTSGLTTERPNNEDAVAVNEQIIQGRANAAAAGGQTITSFIISPATVVGGRSSAGIVSLRYAAPAGGLVISLKNSDPSGASIPERVTVSQGKDSAHFPITTKPVKSHVSLSLSATCQSATATNALTLLPPEKSRWYVTPAGNPKGQGTQTSPWDLATALAHGPSGTEVKPGDTIWLRAGRYIGTFVSTMQGKENAPIIVRAYPGERVIFDKASVAESKQPALKVKGSWVWFWGIEVMNSNPDRRRNSPYSGADEPWRGSGADVYAPHVKFINMIFHDNGHGIWDKQDMTEVHGCLFFYNGNNKREHSLYIGNASGTKYITDNILFAQGGYGILAHSNSASSSQKGLHLEGNIVFNNGILTNDDQKTGNLQVGGVRGVPAERIVLKNNYIYNPATNANNKNNGIRLGYEDTGNRDVKLLDNYIVSKSPLLLWWWQSVDFQGNTIVSDDESMELKMPDGITVSSYRWDFNSYFSERREPVFANGAGMFGFSSWRQMTGLDGHSQAPGARRPTGAQIFVRPNSYEAGRANIVVYNWELRDQVVVDVSSVLTMGTNFEIRDAQNYFGKPLARGTYKGEPILLPMKLSEMPLPVGNVERRPRHTAPEFGVFVLQTSPGK
ncbi:MAG: hypothetical protein ABR556_07450 [Pyrinomonadaceae bacterium]